MSDLVETLKRLPSAEQAAYADAIMKLFRQRPDLRQDYSSSDLAWLQSVAHKTFCKRGCEKCQGTHIQYAKEGPVGFCDCVPKFSPHGEKRVRPVHPLVPHMIEVARAAQSRS